MGLFIKMPDTNTLDSNRTDKNVTFLKVAISSLIPEECKFKFERNVFEKFDEYEKSYPVIYKNVSVKSNLVNKSNI